MMDTRKSAVAEELIEPYRLKLLEAWKVVREMFGFEDLALVLNMKSPNEVGVFSRVSLVEAPIMKSVPEEVRGFLRKPAPLAPGCKRAFWVFFISEEGGCGCISINVKADHPRDLPN